MRILNTLIIFVLLSTLTLGVEVYMIDLQKSGNFVFEIRKDTTNDDITVDATKYENSYKYELLDFDDNTIDTFYFSFPKDNKFRLQAPFREEGATVIIYSPEDKQLEEIDVSNFGETCGDGICQAHESFKECAGDCPSGSQDFSCDGIKDKICDPDCSESSDPDCKQSSFLYILGLIGSIGLIVIIILILVIKIKNYKPKPKMYKDEPSFNPQLVQYCKNMIGQGYTRYQIRETLVRSGYNPKTIDQLLMRL